MNTTYLFKPQKLKTNSQFLFEERKIQKSLAYKKYKDWDEVKDHMKQFDKEISKIKLKLEPLKLSDKELDIIFKEEFAKLKMRFE